MLPGGIATRRDEEPGEALIALLDAVRSAAAEISGPARRAAGPA